MDLEIVIELYPDLSVRAAIFKAHKDNLISTTQRDYYLSLYPNGPVASIIELQPELKYNLADCRDHYDNLANKTWGEMTCDELDLIVDSYDPETKKKALAYPKTRGYDPE